MKYTEAFPSKYVKSDDLQGREVQVVIASVNVESMGDGEQKLVLHFQGKTKGMICNRTNADRIAHLYGPDTDDWVGKEVTLYTEMVNFQGRVTDGIRVKAPPQRNGKREYVTTPKSNFDLVESRPTKHDDGFGDELPDFR